MGKIPDHLDELAKQLNQAMVQVRVLRQHSEAVQPEPLTVARPATAASWVCLHCKVPTEDCWDHGCYKWADEQSLDILNRFAAASGRTREEEANALGKRAQELLYPMPPEPASPGCEHPKVLRLQAKGLNNITSIGVVTSNLTWCYGCGQLWYWDAEQICGKTFTPDPKAAPLPATRPEA